MEKLFFLIPPSEGKNPENTFDAENLSFNFEKPFDILKSVTEKDLKCTWKRFEEAIILNNDIFENKKYIYNEAIKRYSWVMFSAIDYENMTNNWKTFFEKNFLILSWLYWILKPKDKIGNYKLPIETKWLLDFWWEKIIEEINKTKANFIINLLPISYSKLIFWKNKSLEKLFTQKRKFKIININFLKQDWKKISHWVKKIKWEWIKNICEKGITDYKNFWGENIENWNIIDVNIVKK